MRGYGGGYLGKEGREMERGVREGEILGVVSRNALEVGVDMGEVEVCVMRGYGGSVGSGWEEGGGGGRKDSG